MYRLAHNEYLWAFVAVGLILVVGVALILWQRKQWRSVTTVELQNLLIPDFSRRKPWIKLMLFALGLSLLILGMANPQIGSKMEEVKREGIDLVVCLDVSNSMLAEDLSPNRLDRSRMELSKLLGELRNDRIGMVVFAGEAFVQLPITTDYAAAKMFINSVNTNAVSVQGTAIGAAIEKAMESFDFETPTSKSIIIISDGENHEDNAIEAARAAAEKGVSIHTIGVGSPDGTPIPIYRGNQRIGYRKDRAGSTVMTKLNEDMLMDIANVADGKYVHATNSNTGLRTIFNQLNSMEKTELGSMVFTDYEDRFAYFIGAGLFLLLLELLLPNKKSRSIRNLKIFQNNREA